MNKKNICLVVIIAIVCTLTLFAIASSSLYHFQPLIDFNRAHYQSIYDFALVYSNATEEMRGMNSVSAMLHMAENDLEPFITEMHKIIDEQITLLKDWEIESNTVCIDPYMDISSIIALEHTYYFSKTEKCFNGEIEDTFRFLFIPVSLGARYYPVDCNILKEEYLDKPSGIWVYMTDHSLTNYYTARSSWKILEQSANAYLGDSDISDEKKKWVANYMLSDPYGDLCRRLEKKGMAWDGSPL